MIRMIMELVQNRSFTLTTDDSKQSRLRRLKNGVLQRSVLAPLLFNIYTYDVPSMISRKFAYADDLALLHSSGNQGCGVGVGSWSSGVVGFWAESQFESEPFF